MKILGLTIATIGLVCPSLSFSQSEAPTAQSTQQQAAPEKTTGATGPGDLIAETTLKPTKGSKAGGQVFFFTTEDGLRVHAAVTAATEGVHGIHIHEKGDCSAPDASSAGGHWNPTKGEHGAPNEPEKHAGDLGNIVVQANGTGIAEMVLLDSAHENLDDWSAIIGKSVVLHSGRDDLNSQPAGDSGDRIACGVITRVQTTAH